MKVSRGFLTDDVVLVSWWDVVLLILGKTMRFNGTVYTMRRSVFDGTRKKLAKMEGRDSV